MFNIPQLVYLKPHNKKLRYTQSKKNTFKYNQFAIFAKSSGYLYMKQIEACRKMLRRKLGKKSKIRIHLYPNMPYSSKPKETRMGRGKGANFRWLTQVTPGSLLFSINDCDAKNIKEASNIVTNKIPFKVKINSKKSNKIIQKLKMSTSLNFVQI